MDVLVAPVTTKECEKSKHDKCFNRKLIGRVLQVCVCECHLITTEIETLQSNGSPKDPKATERQREHRARSPGTEWPKEKIRRARRLEKGLCMECGKEPKADAPGVLRGVKCLKKRRQNFQRRFGTKPWEPGGFGRKPIE